jgi:hypothetical protein
MELIGRMMDGSFEYDAGGLSKRVRQAEERAERLASGATGL